MLVVMQVSLISLIPFGGDILLFYSAREQWDSCPALNVVTVCIQSALRVKKSSSACRPRLRVLPPPASPAPLYFQADATLIFIKG